MQAKLGSKNPIGLPVGVVSYSCISFSTKLGNAIGGSIGILVSILCVVNPEVFVIGGGMAKAGDILIESIQKHYTKYAFHAACGTKFKMAELSNNAGIYGGVRLILE